LVISRHVVEHGGDVVELRLASGDANPAAA
jgi:hypothetical protein